MTAFEWLQSNGDIAERVSRDRYVMMCAPNRPTLWPNGGLLLAVVEVTARGVAHEWDGAARGTSARVVRQGTGATMPGAGVRPTRVIGNPVGCLLQRQRG